MIKKALHLQNTLFPFWKDTEIFVINYMAHKNYKEDCNGPETFPSQLSGVYFLSFWLRESATVFLATGHPQEKRVRGPCLTCALVSLPVYWQRSNPLFFEMTNMSLNHFLTSLFPTFLHLPFSKLLETLTGDITLTKLFKQIPCILRTEQCQCPPLGLSVGDVLSVFDFWIVCSSGQVLSLIFVPCPLLVI